MAKKKTEEKEIRHAGDPNVMGLRGAVVEQPITATLDENYMPYAMSVIVSRAIPEIDGFKPSHRKLLYTMYKMGLLTGSRTKSANIVGQTMRLNPHGDQAIYETMVRLAKGNESLLHPFVDSKGNFGKVYSRDMAYAASRYTEAKLSPICAELFRDLDCDAVDFVDNYDNTTKEPALLPTTYPNVLVSANQGIAVGMASQICGFNLGEVCDTTIAYLKNPAHDIASTLLAPDFPTGGQIICDGDDLRAIYSTGRGGLKVRARWRYDKKENVVEVYEIPYSTTIEAILDKVAELVKAGKVKEIADMRDETDLSGLKLAIDLKRGVDPDKLMAKLYRLTPLQDTVSCNFNILIAGMPRVLGVGGILEEWTAWRTDCVKRRVYYILSKKKEKLHLLQGLKRILLDIDKAIAIIRETEEEAEVIPNLMIGFGIDQIQAEYVAEIKLRNINKEYILKRTRETDALRDEIDDLEDLLNEAALLTGRRGQRFITEEAIHQSVIKVIAGPEKHSRVVPEAERRLTAYHEAGHAVVMQALPDLDPVHQITIVPRGQAGGMTIYLPEEDRSYLSRRYMLDRVAGLLGGRAAEEMMLGDISTGASSDIQRATAIARKMVGTYGMSSRLGNVAFDAGTDEVFIGKSMAHTRPYSEKTAAEMDAEIRAIIDEAYEKCREILARYKTELTAVAEYLLEHETMDGDTFKTYFTQSGESRQ